MAASAPAASTEKATQWAKRICEVQQKRSPDDFEAALRRAEQQRRAEVSYRTCKAAKGNSLRSRALAAEGLRQISSAAAPQDVMEAQSRWQNAQKVSTELMNRAITSVSAAVGAGSAAVLLDDAADEEEQAYEEVAHLIGGGRAAGELRVMGEVGVSANTADSEGEHAKRARTGGELDVDKLLELLRVEPPDEESQQAKFLLYEGYAKEVENMREILIKFHNDTKPNVPPAFQATMDHAIRKVDSAEAMGIPDDAREWFVFSMMKQAGRNNVNMAQILDSFEKKLELLANQSECPVCLEAFEAEGDRVPQTLGCCHKVCGDCWRNWCAALGGPQRAFCPLCRQPDFLREVTSMVSHAA